MAKTANDLDSRLEAVMDSHRDPEPSGSEASGLESFAMRPSISEEIGATRGKAASADLNIWRAREMLGHIAESRVEAAESFHDTLKTAAAQYAYELEEQAEVSNYIATLRGTR
jgi:hypothetical protein